MTYLESADRKLFFENWLGLLTFVNDKHKLIKGFGHPKSPVGVKLESVVKIKEKLWQDVSIIDEYIDSVWDMPKDNIQILKEWKNSIPGHFLIIRHLKKYSVFMHDDKTLYGVHGISNPISDTFPAEILPTMVKTSLLPFKDKIIYDSILQYNNVTIGPNMRRGFNTTYSEIKKNKGIVENL